MDNLGDESVQIANKSTEKHDIMENGSENESKVVEFSVIGAICENGLSCVPENKVASISQNDQLHSSSPNMENKQCGNDNDDNILTDTVLKTYSDVASSPIFKKDFYQSTGHTYLHAQKEIAPGSETESDKKCMPSMLGTFGELPSYKEAIKSEQSDGQSSNAYLKLKSEKQQEDIYDGKSISIPSSDDPSSCDTDDDHVEGNKELEYQAKADVLLVYDNTSCNSKIKTNEQVKSKIKGVTDKETSQSAKIVSLKPNNNHITEDTTSTTSDKSKIEYSAQIINLEKTDKSTPNKDKRIEKLNKVTGDDPSIKVSRQATPTYSRNSPIYNNQDKRGKQKWDENSDFDLPSEDNMAKVVANVEHYFIDFNILKNNFLLKHIRRNKEGYVSLKLITSFRKVKSVTKDWRVVAFSLTKSKMMELNPEQNKVRRIEPIPKIEDTSFGKSLVVFNLPFQRPTNELLKELFAKFGDIVYAEVMNTRSKNCNLYHRKCLYFNRDIASHLFGVVEFKKYEELQSALKDDEGYLPKENTMSVVPLVAKYYKSSPKKPRFKSYNSFPRNYSGRFNPKYEYSRDNYPTHAVNDYRYSKYNSRDEILPRGKFSYEANNKFYFRRLEAPKFYPKQSDAAYNNKASKPELKCCNCNQNPEVCRQNRQLKINTSLNIERLHPTPFQKTETIPFKK